MARTVVGLHADSAAALPAFIRHMGRLGAADEELRRTLPGDDVVADPRPIVTNAVTTAAPPEQVWPWIVQIGRGRGGSYTCTWFENLVGADIHNPRPDRPGTPGPGCGDGIWLTAERYLGFVPGQAWHVKGIDREHALVLVQRPAENPGAGKWAPVVEPTGDRCTGYLSHALLRRAPRRGRRRCAGRILVAEQLHGAADAARDQAAGSAMNRRMTQHPLPAGAPPAPAAHAPADLTAEPTRGVVSKDVRPGPFGLFERRFRRRKLAPGSIGRGAIDTRIWTGRGKATRERIIAAVNGCAEWPGPTGEAAALTGLADLVKLTTLIDELNDRAREQLVPRLTVTSHLVQAHEHLVGLRRTLTHATEMLAYNTAQRSPLLAAI